MRSDLTFLGSVLNRTFLEVLGDDGWCIAPKGRAMPENPSRSRTPNRILSRLPREDFGLLEPHLAPVDLPVRKQLEAPKKRIDQVYFIEAGFASVVANGSSKPSIEVGIIGREGMTGLATVMGELTSLVEAIASNSVPVAAQLHRAPNIIPMPTFTEMPEASVLTALAAVTAAVEQRIAECGANNEKRGPLCKQQREPDERNARAALATVQPRRHRQGGRA